MKRNGKLSLALHTLGHMAADPARSRTSAEVAEHSGTHPGFVRRVLGLLREAELVTSEKGHRGGWSLARPPSRISLADVYLALGEPMMSIEPYDGPSTCVVEAAMRSHMEVVLAEAEQRLVKRLRETSLAKLSTSMLDGQPPSDLGPVSHR